MKRRDGAEKIREEHTEWRSRNAIARNYFLPHHPGMLTFDFSVTRDAARTQGVTIHLRRCSNKLKLACLTVLFYWRPSRLWRSNEKKVSFIVSVSQSAARIVASGREISGCVKKLARWEEAALRLDCDEMWRTCISARCAHGVLVLFDGLLPLVLLRFRWRPISNNGRWALKMSRARAAQVRAASLGCKRIMWFHEFSNAHCGATPAARTVIFTVDLNFIRYQCSMYTPRIIF